MVVNVVTHVSDGTEEEKTDAVSQTPYRPVGVEQLATDQPFGVQAWLPAWLYITLHVGPFKRWDIHLPFSAYFIYACLQTSIYLFIIQCPHDPISTPYPSSVFHIFHICILKNKYLFIYNSMSR